MKILLINQSFFPDEVATSQYVTDIARDLASRGHDVTVIAARRDYVSRDRLYPRFAVEGGIRVLRVGSTGFGKSTRLRRMVDTATFDIALLWRMARLPRQDIVVAFTSPPLVGLYGAVAASLWGARFVHWIMNINHAIALELGYVRRGTALARLLVSMFRHTLRKSDRIVVMDRRMKKAVESENVIRPEKIAVVPLWPIHDHDSDSGAAALAFRERHGLSGRFVVLHSGNLSYIHPLDTVLAAAVRLKHDSSLVFVFIGHGLRERDIDQVVAREHLSNIVKLPYQRRGELGASLGAADLHLIVMGEAASGLAHSSKIYSILASGGPFLFAGPHDSHITDDFLNDYAGAFHAPNDDVEEFLSCLEKARRLTPEERADIARHNRSLVASHFDRTSAIKRASDVVLASDIVPTPRLPRQDLRAIQEEQSEAPKIWTSIRTSRR